LTRPLTLDFQNLSNALFVFQTGSTLTTASSSPVSVINGNSADGIFWQVGSSAALGSSTVFAGNILADASVTLNTTEQI
jgi:type VI secretion system secreted protein VgrG